MTTTNGTTERKSLQSQLDRLDAILDGLADSLNDAVATAVRETIDQAVREAIPDGFRALTSDPAMAGALHGTCLPPAALIFDGAPIRPAEPPRFPALKELLMRVRRRAAQRWHQTRTLAALVCQYGKRVLAVLLVALLVGLAGYLAGPVLCGTFIAGLVVSASAVAAWQRWRQPTVLAKQFDAASPTPEPAARITSTTPPAATV